MIDPLLAKKPQGMIDGSQGTGYGVGMASQRAQAMKPPQAQAGMVRPTTAPAAKPQMGFAMAANLPKPAPDPGAAQGIKALVDVTNPAGPQRLFSAAENEVRAGVQNVQSPTNLNGAHAEQTKAQQWESLGIVPKGTYTSDQAIQRNASQQLTAAGVSPEKQPEAHAGFGMNAVALRRAAMDRASSGDTQLPADYPGGMNRKPAAAVTYSAQDDANEKARMLARAPNALANLSTVTDEGTGLGMFKPVASAPGVVKADKLSGHAGPVYSNDAAHPLADLNTVEGVTGGVGNISVLSGMSDQDKLNAEYWQRENARLDKSLGMDGPSVGVIRGGGVDVMGQRGGTVSIMSDLKDLAAKGKTRSQRTAAMSALAQLHGDETSLQASQMRLDANMPQQGMTPQQPDVATTLANQQRLSAGALDLKGRQRMDRLMTHFEGLNDQNDPEGTGRKALGMQILTLQGKEPAKDNPKDYLMTVGGGQEWDAKANAVLTRPTRMYDARAGKFVGEQAAAAPKAGTIEAGADGVQYRFKGGDPSQPSSWEKV